MAKGHQNQQNKRPLAEAATNVTPIETKAGENTNEILLQIFDPTEKYILTLLVSFCCNQIE